MRCAVLFVLVVLTTACRPRLNLAVQAQDVEARESLNVVIGTVNAHSRVLECLQRASPTCQVVID